MSSGVVPPIAGLKDLSVESRAIATPWSRIVRGIGLGQNPVGYDRHEAERVRGCVVKLHRHVGDEDPYTTFASTIIELILATTNPAARRTRPLQRSLIEQVAHAVHDIQRPYSRAIAGTILIDAVAKLRIDPSVLICSGYDIPEGVLADVDAIAPDDIRDENQGKHGDYERVAAWTAVFLAFRNLGIGDRLVTSGRDRIEEALSSIERIPTPFFRGRGGSMLLTAANLLGHGNRLRCTGDHIESILSYLDRVDDLQLYPSFPSPMSKEFIRIYPLLTMLNTIGITAQHKDLHFGRNRLHEAAALMNALEPAERTHMSLYYVIALYNLGRLEIEIPNIDDYVEGAVRGWRDIDPGRDYFLHGISYAYLTQLAYFTGRVDLISDEMLDRMTAAFPPLEHSVESRANRPYPFSYTLNVLGELGLSDRLLTPHQAYGQQAPYSWVIDHMSPGGKAESGRLYMLNHALISWALRTRPPTDR